MRKILISIVTVLLLVGTIIFMVQGSEFTEVKGFIELNEKNQEVEDEITRLNSVVNKTYTKAKEELEKSTDDLLETKAEFENKAVEILTGDNTYAKQSKGYDIDFLWTKIGNYAKDEGVIIKIDVVSSALGEKLTETYNKLHPRDENSKGNFELYDLKFTVTGGYANITNFIYDIEQNSKLGFKIDEFSMEAPADLTATFTCKQIPINLGKLEADKRQEAENNTTSNDTNDTTNNTASNSTASNSTETNSTDNNTTNSTKNNNTTNNTTANTTNTNSTKTNTTKNETKANVSTEEIFDNMDV